MEHGPNACDAPTIKESELQVAVVQAINLALGNRDDMLTAPQENVEAVIRQEDESSVEGIEAKLTGMQKAKRIIMASQRRLTACGRKSRKLWQREDLKKRIAEMREFLNSQVMDVTKYDEQLVRRLVGKVTVYEEWFEVEFKSGMTVDVKR